MTAVSPQSTKCLDLNACSKPPKQRFFLFGIRGSGKSTWVREQFSSADRFDLLSSTEYRTLVSDPDAFASRLRAIERGSWVVVDEVQRLPELLNEVHRFIEDRDLKFALLGSSARKLKSAGTNLLAGRALQRRLFPLVPAELGTAFCLERTLRTGSIALIEDSAEPEEALEAYVDLYLREEIRAEAQVRNLGGFLRFLPVAAVAHGQVLNVAGLSRDAAVSRTTVSGFLEILEDTLVARRLPAFEAKLRYRERRHHKFYWVDPGLVRTIKQRRGPVLDDERGTLFEGWLFTVLQAHNQTNRAYDEIAYWAASASANVEVDFILRRGKEILAIEAKSSTRFMGRMPKGLDAIGSLDQVVRRIMVYLGERKLVTESGIEVLPSNEFLDQLANDRLWP